MAIDPYAACPGGTGKKIKFCCGDLVGDLEQLDRLVEGNQVAAASEMVDRLQQRYPDRACLMATKVKLELAARRPAQAAAANDAFVAAHPHNVLALGQSALCEAIAGRLQESAAAFDKAREVATDDSRPELVRIAATLVQVAAQVGSVGLAQGLAEWVDSTGLLDAEQSRALAMTVGMAGVPPALRTRPGYESTSPESPWRFEFDKALEHARHWRLSRAATTFRSLKGVAGDSPELFTNIAIVCELLARPFEAAEAWLTVAKLVVSKGDPDAAERAVEVTARAVELEQEANPDRSPTVGVERLSAFVPAAEADSIDRLEDRLRHDPRFRGFPVERADWVARNLAPPRSGWRVAAPGPLPGDPARVLGSLLIFGRQTDREPEAILQGFAPDIVEARGIVEPLFEVTFAPSDSAGRTGAVTPTQWLLSATYMVAPPSEPPSPPADGEPAVIDTLLARERALRWDRFANLWPDTPLPELLGRSPREAAGREDCRTRLEAVILDEEASSRQEEGLAAWQRIRDTIGLPKVGRIESQKPIEEVSPMLWHRIDMSALGLESLRELFLAALATGFDVAAERAAAAIAGRADASSEDRWEALGLLEERADSTVRRLEIIGELRSLAATLGANDGMIDAAELRVRLQRGEETAIRRLLDHVGREHARDEKVIRAITEVLAEAGIDVNAMVRGAASGRSPGPAGPVAPVPKAEQGGIWTPGSSASAAGGAEKKTIWTPD